MYFNGSYLCVDILLGVFNNMSWKVSTLPGVFDSGLQKMRYCRTGKQQILIKPEGNIKKFIEKTVNPVIKLKKHVVKCKNKNEFTVFGAQVD